MSYLELALKAKRTVEREAIDSPNAYATGSELSELSEESNSDPYACRLQAAFARINRPDYPAGMIPWLGETAPGKYALLTATIPNQLQKIWETRGDLAQFQGVLDEWVSVHAASCKKYQLHLLWNG